MLIHRFLEESTQRDPSALLVVHGRERATYGELDAAANRLAGLLVDRGVGAGDRVGLLLPNSSRYVAAYYGTLKAGAIAVPMHAGSDARTVGRLLRDCAARAIIGGERSAERVAKAAPELPELRVVILPDAELRAMARAPQDAPFGAWPAHVSRVAESETDAMPPIPPARRIADTDRATIIYTSGSTGHPRGAILSHRNVATNTRSILAYLRLTKRDRVLALLPFPYVYGKSLLNTHVAVGGSLVLEDNLLFPNVVLNAIEREEATGLSGVPSTFAILLNRSNLATRELSSLRYVTQAGGAMPVPHIQRLLEVLPSRVRLFVMYGATEASARLSCLDPDDLRRKLGSIGKAIPGVELTVRRDDGGECADDEVGEIVARGENIMEGYWGDPEATAEVLDGHGFHTGDLARRDADGFLWVVGRKRDMIKSGAHRIGAREIEETLLECAGVDEAAVVGVPDEVLGEAIVGHVTLRPGVHLTGEELRLFCQERLPAHKVPRQVQIREKMPFNSSGKIDKLALREAAG
jgi:acyl-CoA synthetase (AMP-forming)/AMP-acid ligase II